MRKLQLCLTGLIVLGMAFVLTPHVSADAVFIVNARVDTSDIAPGDGICADGLGRCTLRAAIEEADNTPGHDFIHFSIGSGPQTIRPIDGFWINDTVTIDATTQPGYAGTPLIRINGDRAGSADGIRIYGDNVTIRGLAIGNFASHSGLYINGDNNVIEGNYLGVNPDGLTAQPNLVGMSVALVANNTRIGGLSGVTQGNPCHNPCNLISGNTWRGLEVFGPDVTVQGNVVGLDGTGSAALANGRYGVLIWNGPTRFGGTDPNAGNVVSGNGLTGLRFIPDLVPGTTTDFSGSFIKGNLIGLDQSGTIAIGNGGSGVDLAGLSGPFTIGGETAAERNVISGNAGDGLIIVDSTDVDILNNYVGLNASGTTVLGNGGFGILLSVVERIQVGRLDSTTRNYIAGSSRDAIAIWGTPATEARDIGVYRNVIGTGPTFSLDGRNNGAGIAINRASGVRVGHAEPDAGNIIVNSDYNGIFVRDSHDNTIQGNYVGWHPMTGPMGNTYSGINIDESSDNLIGGPRPDGATDCAGPCNWIAYNTGSGVSIWSDDVESVGNRIQSNSIFENAGEGIELQNLNSNEYRDDPLDADSGSNLAQNPPVITAVFTDGSRLVIEGSLHSAPMTAYTIEFFVNDDETCPTESGLMPQGKTLLLTGLMQTDPSGNVSFRLPLAASLWDPAKTAYVTATVTDPEGNTSWFSNCAGVELTPERLEISLILIDVQHLVDQGAINAGIGQSLSSKLEAASKQVADQKFKPAINQLKAFTNEVDVLMQRQQLSIKEGTPLIDSANQVILMLGGSPDQPGNGGKDKGGNDPVDNPKDDDPLPPPGN